MAFHIVVAAMSAVAQGAAPRLDALLEEARQAAEREGSTLVIVERGDAAAPASAAPVGGIAQAAAMAEAAFEIAGRQLAEAPGTIGATLAAAPSGWPLATLGLVALGVAAGLGAQEIVRRTVLGPVARRVAMPVRTASECVGLVLLGLTADAVGLVVFLAAGVVVVILASEAGGVIRAAGLEIVTAVTVRRARRLAAGGPAAATGGPSPGRGRGRRRDPPVQRHDGARDPCRNPAGRGRLLEALGTPDDAGDTLLALVRLVSTVALALLHRKVLTRMVFGAAPASRATLLRMAADAAWLPLLILYFCGAWAFRAICETLELGNAGNLVVRPIVAALLGLLAYGGLLVAVDRWFDRPLLPSGGIAPMPAAPPARRAAFRTLFARAAAILAAFAGIVVLLRLWGIPVLGSDHPLAEVTGLLMVVFGAWLAYQAVRIWFDQKIAEEMPAEAGPDGEEKAVGASRLATLLPILKAFLLVSIVVLVGMMVRGGLPGLGEPSPASSRRRGIGQSDPRRHVGLDRSSDTDAPNPLICRVTVTLKRRAGFTSATMVDQKGALVSVGIRSRRSSSARRVDDRPGRSRSKSAVRGGDRPGVVVEQVGPGFVLLVPGRRGCRCDCRRASASRRRRYSRPPVARQIVVAPDVPRARRIDPPRSAADRRPPKTQAMNSVGVPSTKRTILSTEFTSRLNVLNEKSPSDWV